MNLSRKEIEFLKEINETEERGNPITFDYKDAEKVKKYQKKYGDVYESLSDAYLFTGSFCSGSVLNITDKGKNEIVKILEEENSKKGFKNNIILLIIGAVIGGLVTELFHWLFRK